MKKINYSVNETAEILGVTRQAVYLAIRLKKLEVEKIDLKWRISQEELEEFKKNRYDHTKTTRPDGALKFDPSEGRYSIRQFAEFYEVPRQRIYYLIHAKRIKYTRDGSSLIILVKDEDATRKVVNSYLADEGTVAINRQE